MFLNNKWQLHSDDKRDFRLHIPHTVYTIYVFWKINKVEIYFIHSKSQLNNIHKEAHFKSIKHDIIIYTNYT